MFRGELSIYTDNPEDVQVYPLKIGKHTIGTSIVNSIRIGTRLDTHIKDIHCIVDVDKDGLVTVTNKAPLHPVRIGSQSAFKPKLLKSGDVFSIDIYNFQYKSHSELPEVLVENRRITPRKRRKTLFEPRLLGSRSSTPFKKNSTPRSGTPNLRLSSARKIYGSKENNSLLRTIQNKIPETPENNKTLTKLRKSTKKSLVLSTINGGDKVENLEPFVEDLIYEQTSQPEAIELSEVNTSQSRRSRFSQKVQKISENENENIESSKLNISIKDDIQPLRRSVRGVSNSVICNTSIYSLISNDDTVSTPEVHNGRNTRHSKHMTPTVDKRSLITIDLSLSSEANLSSRKLSTPDLNSRNSSVMLIDFSLESNNLSETDKIDSETSLGCFDSPSKNTVTNRRTRSYKVVSTSPNRKVPIKTCYTEPRSTKFKQKKISLPGRLTTFKNKSSLLKRSSKRLSNLLSVSFQDVNLSKNGDVSQTEEKLLSHKKVDVSSPKNWTSISNLEDEIYSESSPQRRKLQTKCATEPRNKKRRPLKKSLPAKLNNLNDNSIRSFSVESEQCNEALTEVSRISLRRSRQSMIYSESSPQRRKLQTKCATEPRNKTRRPLKKSLPAKLNNLNDNSIRSFSVESEQCNEVLAEVSRISLRSRQSLVQFQNESVMDVCSDSTLESTNSDSFTYIPNQRSSAETELSFMKDSQISKATRKLSRTKKSLRKTDSPLVGPINIARNIKQIKAAKLSMEQSDNFGIKKLLKTSKVQREPKSDLTEVTGIKRLLRTPRVQKGPNNDLMNVTGIQKLFRTPKLIKEPYNDLTNPIGIKKLLATPRVQKEPMNDLTNPVGIKKLLKTPKVQKEPKNDLSNVAGVKRLLRTPIVQKEPNNDLSNPVGLKKLMTTPKVQKEPKNDLSNPVGLKKLVTTPKVQKEPKNDLTNPVGIKKLLKTPKIQNSPKNDLTNPVGVKKLMRTPKVQREPLNDLRNVAGIRKLMTTPKIQTDPQNDLTDMFGEHDMNLSDFTGLQKLFNMSSKEEDEEQIFGPKTIIRTYSKQSLSPLIPLVSNETFQNKRRGRPSSLPGKSELNPEEHLKSMLDTSVGTSKGTSIIKQNRRKRGRPSSLPSCEPTDTTTGIRTRRRGAPAEDSPTKNEQRKKLGQEDTIEEPVSMPKRGRAKKGSNVKKSKNEKVLVMEQDDQKNLESGNDKITPNTIQDDTPITKRSRRILTKKEPEEVFTDESMPKQRTRRQNKENIPADNYITEITPKLGKAKRTVAQTKKEESASKTKEAEEISEPKRSKKTNKNKTDKEKVTSPKRSRKRNIPTDKENMEEEMPVTHRTTRKRNIPTNNENVDEEIVIKQRSTRKRNIPTDKENVDEEMPIAQRSTRKRNIPTYNENMDEEMPITQRSTRRKNKMIVNEKNDEVKQKSQEESKPTQRKKKTISSENVEEYVPRTLRSRSKRI